MRFLLHTCLPWLEGLTFRSSLLRCCCHTWTRVPVNLLRFVCRGHAVPMAIVAAAVAAAAAAPVVAGCEEREAAKPCTRARLMGRVCLVTGGASGIGKAICIQLACEGASIVVLDHQRAPREGGHDVRDSMRKAREVQGLPPRKDIFILGSVSEEGDVARALAAAVQHFGKLDVLINNAAKMDGATLLETSEEEWDAIMTTNVKGVFLCTKAAIEQFLKQDCSGSDGIRGRVVNISSQHGMVHCPGNVGYGTSKAAVAYFTRQVACDYISQGIVVNAVAPGRILTGRPGSRLDAQSPHEESELLASFARTPHGSLRLGCPQDVASAVAFLASDDASFIVGENLMVDGGYMAS